MSWTRTPVDTKNIKMLYKRVQLAIKNGDSNIERLRIVILYKDNSCIYLYTIFDFYDNYSTFKQDSIEKFYIYQPLTKS